MNFVLGLLLHRRSRNSSRQGAEELLMDVDCRKCFCVTFDKSNKTAVSGKRDLCAVSGTKNTRDWRKMLIEEDD